MSALHPDRRLQGVAEADLGQEVTAQLGLLFEGPEHGGRGHAGIGFLDAAHHAAHMGAFDQDCHTLGVEGVIQEAGKAEFDNSLEAVAAVSRGSGDSANVGLSTPLL